MTRSERAADPYLDCIAKSPDSGSGSVEIAPGVAGCGRWAALGACSSGHAISRTILCNREWCNDCGQKDSDAHKRRWQRWLTKAQQLEVMGYLVVTFPISIRKDLRTRGALTEMATNVTNALRSCGFSRGLRRWHFFGDASTLFNPHLNYLLDSGRIRPERLRAIKEAISEIVGVECVIHYQYTRVEAKKLHLLKYVTRPTFLDYEWDREFAHELYGFRTTWVFGKWDGPILWTMQSSKADVDPHAIAAMAGICLKCGEGISWMSTVVPQSVLDRNQPISYGARYFGYPPDTVQIRAFAIPPTS